MANILKPISGLLENISEQMHDHEILASNIRYDVSMMIHRYRLSENMTQRQFAEMMEVTQSMVSKWESGEYNFSIEQIAKVCDRINCEPKISFCFGTSFDGSHFAFPDLPGNGLHQSTYMHSDG